MIPEYRCSFGVGSRFLWKERVFEFSEGAIIWERDVLAFELDGHATAFRCFAWQDRDGRLKAVLAEGPVQTAQDAVRASIMADEDQASEGA